MSYTNSKMASFVKISPNRNSPRNNEIHRISIHCVVGQLSVETMGYMFEQESYQASSNYGIGSDGRVGLYVEEKDRSWCTSSKDNDNQAITIECACDLTHPYAVNDKVYNTLLDLVTDICKRNKKTKVTWIDNKDKALAYKPEENEILLTVHRWFAAKECPGEYLYSRHGKIAEEVTRRLNGGSAPAPASDTDKIWMGWVSRESGSKGFTQTNGDSGNAYGKYQFDRRYALVPFMEYCVSHNSKRYGGFQKFINYKAGSSKLLNNSELAKLWEKFCKSYPEEFEKLQDVYAYQYYYLEAVRYFEKLYGIKITNRSAALKGTLYSMSIRSGALCAAQKFEGSNRKSSDLSMINKSYKTYGSSDANRWTKAGQWGDAVNALNSGAYTDVPISMASDVKPTPTPVPEPKPVTPSSYYVQAGLYSKKANATALVNALKASGFTAIVKTIGTQYRVQVGAFKIKANAEKRVNELKKAGFEAIIKEE